MMPVLNLKGVRKAYGAVIALDDGDLDLRPGEIHILMGANGSGKSTLCKILAGSVSPDAGEITLNGEPVQFGSPEASRKMGVSTFYQELSLANNRSVAENILMNDLPSRNGFVDRLELGRRAAAAIEPFAQVVGDGFDSEVPVGQLRADQRQLVEIMKTFESSSDILIFDEPTSALDREQSEVFFTELKRRRDDGALIVFISHRMEEVFEIGDRVTVIRDGRTISTAKLSQTSADKLVSEMVGKQTSAEGPSTRPAPTDRLKARLSVTDMTNSQLRNVSLTLHAGEVLGLGGLHGQGQSELLRCLFGISAAKGDVTLDGADVTINSPRKAIQSGLAYVSGDRGRNGAITERPIFENVVPIQFLKRAMMLVRPNSLGKDAKDALAILSTKYSGLGASIGSLSGGNQQKVIISRWMIDRPEVFLLDDPTKGIDLVTKIELFALIRKLARDGMAIILYSSEDAELLANSDRVLIFNNGSIVKELTGDEKTRANLTRASFEAA